MCDGQFRLMQNYLREQKDNILTINLVGEVALFAQVYTNSLCEVCNNLSYLIRTSIQTLIKRQWN